MQSIADTHWQARRLAGIQTRELPKVPGTKRGQVVFQPMKTTVVITAAYDWDSMTASDRGVYLDDVIENMLAIVAQVAAYRGENFGTGLFDPVTRLAQLIEGEQ